MVLQESSQPKDFFVFLRGNPLARGERVQPKFLSALSSLREQTSDLPYRDIVSNLASTFDGANPNACTIKRPDTTVPQQTLFALNSEFIQDRAIKLDSLSQSAAGQNDTLRVEWLYRRLFSRNPEPEEVDIAIQFVRSSSSVASSAVANSEKLSSNGWQRLAHALLASNEFIFVD